MATQNNVIVRNCNHHEKPCEQMIDPNANQKIKDYLLLGGLVSSKPGGQPGGLYQNGEGLKGIAVSYGNAKTGESGFCTVGYADSKGRLYDENTPFNFYSSTKNLTGLIFAKCLEENLINTIDEPVCNYIPEFRTTVKYIKSVTITPGDENKPEKWTYELDDYNLATLTFNNLLTFSFGYLYSAYYMGTLGSNFMFNSGFYKGLADLDTKYGTIIGKATGLHLYLYRKFIFENQVSEP